MKRNSTIIRVRKEYNRLESELDQSSEENAEAMVRKRPGGRVTYTDPVTGKRHDRQRRAENKVDAGDKVHALLAEVDATGGRSLAKEHMTFSDLATYFEKQYLIPAEYVDGRKVAGVRSISPAVAAVKVLKGHFG